MLNPIRNSHCASSLLKHITRGQMTPALSGFRDFAQHDINNGTRRNESFIGRQGHARFFLSPIIMMATMGAGSACALLALKENSRISEGRSPWRYGTVREQTLDERLGDLRDTGSPEAKQPIARQFFRP